MPTASSLRASPSSTRGASVPAGVRASSAASPRASSAARSASMREGTPRAMRFVSPSRGASGPAFMNFTSSDDRQRRSACPTSSSGVASTSCAEPEQLEEHVRVKARELAARPGRQLGPAPLARALARLLGDRGGLALEARAAVGAEQRRARARDGDAERARVDAQRAAPRRHGLDEDGAAAAERIDDEVAARAEGGDAAARDRGVHAPRVAVEPVRERPREARRRRRAACRACAPPRPRRRARPVRPASRTRAAGAARTARRRGRAAPDAAIALGRGVPAAGRLGRLGPLARLGPIGHVGHPLAIIRSTWTTRRRPRGACPPRPPSAAPSPCPAPAAPRGCPAGCAAARRAARRRAARRPAGCRG